MPKTDTEVKPNTEVKSLSKKDNKEPNGNLKFTQEKRNNILELLKRDVSVETACKYHHISVQTFHNRRNSSKKLLEEYEAAKVFLDVAAADNIANSIIKSKSVRDSWEWKKRRDRRYADKQEVTWEGGEPLFENVTVTVNRGKTAKPAEKVKSEES